MFFMLPIGYGGGGILGFIIIFLIIRTIARLLFRSRRGSGQDQNSNGYHYYYYNGNGYSQGNQYQYQQQQQQRAYGQSGSRDPYAVLGVTNSASDDDIKKAYRKLIMENHPDRVMDKSDAEKKQAEKRFREVQDAYERICKLRGIN